MSALLEALAKDGVEGELVGNKPMALPTSEAQVQAVLKRAHADGLRVVPMGLGSKLEWCRPEYITSADLLVSTRRMDKIIDYVPGDGTLTAQAGCTMTQLEEHVLTGGHRLTPAVALPGRSTLGGVLAAGLSGPDRQKRGPVRHHVLGTRVVLPDGTLARSGGRLVKNVTGYDLHRLHTGSRGTLCILLEASLRLFPRADDHTHLIREEAELDGLLARCVELRTLECEPLAWTLENHGGPWRLHVALEGRGRAHEEDVRDVERVLAPQEILRGPQADEAFDALRGLDASGGWGEARALTRTSRLSAILRMLEKEDGLHVVAQMGLGEVRLQSPGLNEASTERQIEQLEEWRQRLTPLGARLEPRMVRAQTQEDLAPALAAQPALDWMFRLQDEFDPKAQFRSPSFPGRRA
jgi:glycolate oxidase FAD binding subunit